MRLAEWRGSSNGVGGEHNFEIAAPSNGTVSGGGTYRAGATATEALPSPGHAFTGWSGTLQVTTPFHSRDERDRTVGATFAWPKPVVEPPGM